MLVPENDVALDGAGEGNVGDFRATQLGYLLVVIIVRRRTMYGRRYAVAG